MNMNANADIQTMQNDAERVAEPSERVAAPSDNLLAQVTEEARAHNARRFMTVQQAQAGMGVAAEVYGELSKTKLYRAGLFGTYAFFWLLAAVLAILAFGNAAT